MRITIATVLFLLIAASANAVKAILKIWFGAKPADDDLKRAMLGAKE